MKNNLPASYSGSIFEVNGGLDFRANTLLVYSGSLSKLKWDRRKRLKFINELQDSYSGTALSLE
jgi:hypothetical protein